MKTAQQCPFFVMYATLVIPLQHRLNRIYAIYCIAAYSPNR